jgi:amino acid adenylation domain-containing protein
MNRADIEDVYRLSPIQHGMLFHTLYAPESGVYCEQFVAVRGGDFDPDAHERSWQVLVDRHPILRTAFLWADLKDPVQAVYRRAKLPYERVDWRAIPAGEQGRRLQDLMAEGRRRGFDLQTPPLMRFTIVRFAEDSWRILWSYHHLLLDGWSTGLLYPEFLALYDAAVNGEAPPPAPQRPPFRDYIAWLRQQDLAAAEAYWRRTLAGFTSPTSLVCARPAGSAAGSGRASRSIGLPDPEGLDLGVLCQRQRLTVASVMHGSWAFLLARYAGEEDVIFGSTVSGRPLSLPGAEAMLGCFINTLPVRVRLAAGERVLPFLQGVQAGLTELRRYEHSPLVEVQGWSEVPRQTPLFDSIVVIEALTATVDDDKAYQRTNYPLTLVVGLGNEFRLRLDFDSSRYASGAIDALLGQIRTVFRAFAASLEGRLDEVSLLTAAERQELLAAGSRGEPRCAGLRPLHRRFEEQAARTPGAPAVTCGGESRTYAELNARANRLAHALRRSGVGPESRVGLCVERSFELVEAILGILKAGGAYVPLDPGYPASRLALIAEDSGLDVLVTTEALRERVPGGARQVICLDSSAAGLAGGSLENPTGGAGLDSLAYVIYTSGSTGRPKGSLLTHANVARLFAATDAWFHFGSQDVWSLFHSYAFDFSVWEIWGALLYGGRLVVVPYWVSRSPEAFRELLVRERVTVLNQTPSAFRQLAQVDGGGELALRCVIFGGEALEPASLAPWFDRHGDEKPLLVNMYGITETTVHVTWRPVRRQDVAAAGKSPVGVPIPDLAVRLRDRYGNLVPRGVAGEIQVAGAGLARGYLGRPELTAERFVPDPFGDSGGRLYRSGDLARWIDGGDLEYLGRIDHQVKVRGFRIELGEIEAALGAHPTVREAVVLPREEGSGDLRLVGYVVPRESGVDLPGLRAFLKDRLPDYMVPAALVEIPAVPLTAHGKVDRRALPDPVDAMVPAERGSDPPRTPIEELVAGIWSEVLQVGRVGRRESFFDLGGHSLLATQVISRLRAVVGVDLPLRELFEAPTVGELASRIEAARSGPSSGQPPLRRYPREGAPPLSFAQERLWFLDQLQPGTAAYNIPNAVRLNGALDVAALRRALAAIVRRHEALRTVFAVQEGRPVQVIREDLHPALPLADLSALPRAAREMELGRLLAAASAQPFDLAAGPLLRHALLRLGEGEHALLLTFHHIVSDAGSLEVFVRELAALYGAFAAGRPSPLPELPVQYADFARWQRQWLEGAALEVQLAFWRERLAGVPLLRLPGDRPRPAVQGSAGAMLAFALPEPLAAAVHALARQRGATVFMALLAAYQVLLSRLAGQEDFAVGAPVAGRERREIEGLIGFFVNTLVLRSSMAEDLEGLKLLERTRALSLEAYAHQGVPFERVVQEVAPERNLSYTPLFQAMLSFQSLALASLELPGLSLSPVSEEFPVSKFDLTLTAFDSGTQIFGRWVYSTALFERATIARWKGHFEVLLEGLTADPKRRVSELPLLTGREREQLLAEWNRPPVDYPEEGFVHRLFEAQAERTPEAVAVVLAGEALSYRELNARANRLARRLRRLGAGPETLVGIRAERSFEMVVALLAVLKSGSAYVPLDPALPAERLSFMIADAGIELLLTEELPGSDGERDDNLAAVLSPENPAYVIYTSGSTGQPKGVVVSHRSLGNRLQYARAGDVLASDAFLQKTTISFDVSLLEIFAPLVTGGRTVLARPGGQQDPAYLVELIREQRITYTSFPPSLLNVLFRQEGFDRCDSLRVVVTGGETVPAVLPGQFYERLPGAGLLNRYGPTETTISVTSWLCERGGTPRSLPIGRPTAKARVYLVDRDLQPVPIGVTGEILLGGTCVARGYLRRPDLTAAAFVPDPFAGEPGGRLYRTGDLARYRPDGAVEFVGRADSQVKIRGFRVELGEIEAALARHPAVREAAVIDREDGLTRTLAAYLVPAEGEAPGEAELRRFLLESLPAYMVPADFVLLAALPVAATGKVDRKALPAPGRRSVEASEPPRNPTEELLAAVWAELLARERVGIHDGFFDLGGHSLLATQVMSRVRESFGVELPLRLLFERPTIAALAEEVEAALRAGSGPAAPPLVPLPRRGDLPLSFAQQRLWFLDQLQPGTSTYNMPSAVRFLGDLDVAALHRSLREVVRRHESLRTTFVIRGGRPVQSIAPELELKLPLIDLRGEPEERCKETVRSLAAAEGRRPFDLAAGPLIRATLLRLAEDEHVALLTLHHITSDGWSAGVLVREIAALYPAFLAGAPSPLPALPIQYADFAVWQREWLRGEVLESHLAYWRRQLAGLPPLLELPTDRPRPAVQSFAGRKWDGFLPAPLARGLRELCREEGVTLFMGVLAALQSLLHLYSRQDDLAVGSNVSGRDRLETEGLIGFFVNNLVLRGDLGGNPGFRELLARTREATLGAYTHQDVPFERLVEELAGERSLSHAPLFQVMLVFQNTPRQALQLPGVTLAPVAGEEGASMFDMTLSVLEPEAGLILSWIFSRDLFDRTTIQRLGGHFEALIASLLDAPDQGLEERTILRPGERRQLLEWSRSEPGEAEGLLLHEILESRAGIDPGRTAVISADGDLTYGELNARANRLAHWLRRMGVEPEVRVGLFLERSAETLIGLFGILKAGGAYVPLDPEYPDDRIAWVLKDAGIPLLLTRDHLLDRLPGGFGPQPFCLDGAFWQELAGESPVAPRSGVAADNLAYIIYTSGSTGQPKGVLVPHRGLANLSAAQGRLFKVTAESRILQFASLSFDASVAEIALAVRAGAVLCLPPSGSLLPGAELVDLLRRWEISKATLPPAVAATLPTQDFPALRTVVLAGEACPPEVAERWAAGRLLLNAYGPTETTVCATVGAYVPGSGRLPLGHPISGVGVHVLGADLRLAPLGVPGELCIGGVGVVRGYADRPDLTAGRFVPDPFSEIPGSRLYRSGDLGRFLADGALEFLGRIDQQVKVRGFRIEPGEIEGALLRHSAVREALVVAREEGGRGSPADRRLVAYIVPRDEDGAAAVDWRGFLGRWLPEHMIPSAFVTLAELPRTANGKLDRRSLPAPGGTAAGVQGDVAPRDPLESFLAELWAEALQVDAVGVHDDFFTLGGNSLTGALLVNQLQERLSETLPVAVLFDAPTVDRLAVHLRVQYPQTVARLFGLGGLVEGVATQGTLPERPERTDDIRWLPLEARLREPGAPPPLSFAQERLWFLDQLQPGSPVYNIPAAVRLRGALDVGAFLHGLREVVHRHESLRTTFAVRGGRAVQVIAPELTLATPVVDLGELSPERRESAIRLLTTEERRRPFDLAAGPLIRTKLLSAGHDDHVALLTLHHVVADAWSMGVMIREVGALYSAFVAGAPSPLPELPIQYADFAAWQRECLQGEALESQLAYWRQRLAGHAVLQMPTDRPRPAVQSFRGADEFLAIPAAVSRAVLDLGRSQGTTSYMTLLAAFQALLQRYSGQDDVIVGSTVTGRDRRELEPLIGFFVNTLAMRADLSGRPSFRELLVRVREMALGALRHQHLPFEKLVEELQTERDLSRSPLFQVVFQLQNVVTSSLELPGLELSQVEVASQTAKFDIVLNLSESPEGLLGVWKHNTDLFDRTTLARMSRHFANLLAGAAADPDRSLAELPLLDAAERRQLGLEGSAAPSELLDGPCLHEIFAAQAAWSPEAVAVTFEGEGLRYGELEARANRLARHLIGLGVSPGELVGLCLERSAEMVVAILGVLKAGGAYVPFDPAYPQERLAFMLADSRVKVLLSEGSLAAALPEPGSATRVVFLDREAAGIAGESAEAPEVRVSADHPAYVIYTSGSTGKPKGVVVRHGNAVRLFTATEPWFDFGAQDVWTLFHSYAFDFSVWELWGALLHGGRLVVVPYWVSRSPEAFNGLLARERVTVLNQTPSAFRQLIWAEESTLAGAAPELSLRWVIFGGEALEPASLAPWFERHGDQSPQLINMYGITETTVHVTYRPIGRRDVTGSGSVVGRAIPDLGLYVLDATSRPQPIGVPGEIHVGGAGLALGYLGRPELTAERFIPSPFGEPGSRLYRSGDLARVLADGDLEYLGRIDHQVKIRGFRVELGEIESALAALPGVREAVVLARADGGRHEERRLVAYVAADGEAPILARLREALGASLPEYMLPSALVVLDRLPLTANGKIDRRALPAPDASRPGPDGSYVAPATPLEHFLTGLWQEILEVPRAGVHDDFFALGGSSITGAVLINRLQEELQEIIQVVVIFDAPTIAQLAVYLVEQHPAAVERLFGAEALGGRELRGEDAGAPVGEADLAALRSLIRPLAPLSSALRAKNPPAVFVLSPPRSGSTLLRVMLGGHPDLFSPPELELLSFNTLRERRTAFTGRDAFWLEGAVRAVMEIRGCGAEEAEALIAGCEREDLTALEFYGRMQDWLAGRMLVDKTPSYALDPAILRRAEGGFEEPRYIHLIRHPLGMIHSFEEAKLDQIVFRRQHPFSRRRLAELIWLASHENIVEFLREVPAERQHRVRFEDLLEEPERALREICRFLGLEYHPDMAEPYERTSARMTDGIHAESRMLGDVKFHEHAAVDRSVAERWRERYSRDFVGGPTRELAARLGYDAGRERAALSLVSIQPGDWREGDPLPLSFAQERLWFFEQMEPGSPVYHIPSAVRLEGRLDVAALAASLREIIRRHASLRTTFSLAEGKPVQIVSAGTGFHLPVVDLSALAAERRETEARDRARELVRQPFDLRKGPLLRTVLLRLEGEEHAAVFVMHHIVSDGWSMGVLVGEVTGLYAALSQGLPSPLPELPVQYPDYALWQRRWLRDEGLAGVISFWKETLAGAPVLELPTDRPRPPLQTYRGGKVPFGIPADLVHPLVDLGRTEGATLFMALLAAVAALLARYSGQRDVSIGSPVANRNRAQTEPLIGFLVNTLVFRTDLSGSIGFRELLSRVRRTALAAYMHQDLPFERVVEEVNPRRDLSLSPLFQVMLLLKEEARQGQTLELPGVRLSQMSLGGDANLFDLTFSFTEAPAGLLGIVEHSDALFDAATAARLAGNLRTLLARAVADPGGRLTELPLLCEAEIQQLASWSRAAGSPWEDRCLHELIEARGDLDPGAVAAVAGSESLTYGELEARANRLAHRLRRLGVGPEVRVGLCMRRSLQGIVGILAILKAGGVYLPLDPTHPRERRAWMLADAGARVLLTEEALLHDLPAGPDIEVLCLDAGDWEGAESAERPAGWARPENLAYAIYTSGSTGTPKGVEVEHGAVAAYVRPAAAAYGYGAAERVLQTASWGFDASIEEVLVSLAVGATVVLWDGELDPEELLRRSVGLGVTVLTLTPAFLQLWAREVAGKGAPDLPIHVVITGGDTLSPEVVRLWPSTPLRKARLINDYGPTEAVIVATDWTAPAGDPAAALTSVAVGPPRARRSGPGGGGRARRAPAGRLAGPRLPGEARGDRREVRARRLLRNAGRAALPYR